MRVHSVSSIKYLIPSQIVDKGEEENDNRGAIQSHRVLSYHLLSTTSVAVFGKEGNMNPSSAADFYRGAQHKLQEGIQRLDEAGDSPVILGAALTSFHGALEDYVRAKLATNLTIPTELRIQVLDRGAMQWFRLLELLQQYEDLGPGDRERISQANHIRQEFAHGGTYNGTCEYLENYAAFVQSFMNATDEGKAIKRDKEEISHVASELGDRENEGETDDELVEVRKIDDKSADDQEPHTGTSLNLILFSIIGILIILIIAIRINIIEIFQSRNETILDSVTKSARETTIGLLRKGRDGRLYLLPLAVYGDDKYQSVYLEGWNKDIKRTNSARQSLERMRNFEVYSKGNPIGKFEVIGFGDFSQEGGPQMALVGGIHWQSKPTTDLDITTSDAIALSKPIPQPFWPSGLKLSSKQASSLTQILNETLRMAVNYERSQRPVGTAPKSRTIEIMDLDQDGQPDVYASIRWAGEPCDEMYASVLAMWRGRWIILRRSTYLAECPGREAAGDEHFDASVVDIDGDGVAELILSEGRWESWRRTLYQVRDGQLIKRLNIGGYGS